MKLIKVFILIMILNLGLPAFAEDAQIFAYDDHGRRDPFWPLVSPGGAIINYETDLMISDMILEGIIIGADNKNLAIINGVVVKSQDKIGLFTIKSVEKDSVVLQKEEEEFTLKLKKEE